MKSGKVLSIVGAGIMTLVVLAGLPFAQEEPSATDMAEMLKKAEQFTKPGKHHELLQRFVGTWDTTLRITMQGAETPGEKGTADFSLMMGGRWLKQEAKGTMMGMPMESFGILGYDNFKMSYVFSQVTTMDTALLRMEGDLDPRGNALIVYGTIDEYLTGEHDKMVKGIYRFQSDDKFTLEVHDLPIGETGTKVFEIVYTRKS